MALPAEIVHKVVWGVHFALSDIVECHGSELLLLGPRQAVIDSAKERVAIDVPQADLCIDEDLVASASFDHARIAFLTLAAAVSGGGIQVVQAAVDRRQNVLVIIRRDRITAHDYFGNKKV